ncbi:Tar ligand binding domain-containing protein [Noviherbaspirillum sp. ST9]|uniref:methyl-accepting chemotaxis protein n=1 Tax=Noviherbaspirillum sp. ST9 TaxID=3401606 RepID=UPI003B58AB25
MKKNFPVTGQEKTVQEGIRLVSRTDTKGIITFANDNFVAQSGFTRDELLGSSHNIVRHPDVPPIVFEDMWETLKKGLPWRGVVKNRCKDGDHYWVDAHVVPVRKNGETIGYMSVRTAASRDDIAKAEALYAEAARTGQVPRQSGASWRRFMTVRNGAALGIVFVTLMMIAGGILGITGLTLSSKAMSGLYHEEMAPVQAIGRINFLMADNRAQVALSLREEATGERVRGYMAALERNKREIDALWRDYIKLPHGERERTLAEGYWQARNRYVESGLMPARAALEKGDFAAAGTAMSERVNPLYDDANRQAAALLEFLSTKAEANFRAVADRNQLIIVVAIVGITAGCLIVLFAGIYFFRATVVPLQSAVVALERIAEGNLSGEADTSGFGEPGRVMTGVAIMQLHLKVMMDEIRVSSGSIREQCQRLNTTMMNLAEHSEEQHDRVYQTVDAASLSAEGLGRLADEAERMMLMSEQVGGVAGDGGEMAKMAQELAAAVRIEAFSLGDTVGQMNQVAMLIVENRGEVQGAWAASQRLEKTAQELDKLVKYFD